MLVALLPVLQASAESNTLGISVVEQINSANRYDPNAAGTGGAIAQVTPVPATSGSGTITLTNNAGITLTDVSVEFVPGSTTSWAIDTANPSSTKVTAGTVTQNGAGHYVVNIPRLDAGQYVIVTYAVSNSVKSPVALTTSYTNNKLVAVQGASTTATLTVTRDASATAAGTITGITATSTQTGTAWTITPSTLTFTPDLANPGNSDSGTMTASIADPSQFTSSQTVDEYPLDTATLTFTWVSTAQTSAGVTVYNANAKTGDISIDVTKQLQGGSWTFTPKVSITSGDKITYTLNSVSMWITSNDNMNNLLAQNTVNSGKVNSGSTVTGAQDLTGGDAWTGSSWTWNGLDTSGNKFTGTPAGFMQPSIAVKYTPNQFPVKQSDGTSGYKTTNGAITLARYIYVINGYLVEVQKTVTPVANTPGAYDISLHVSNTGSKDTPDHVVVYDIVPDTFTMLSQATTNPTGSLAGTQNVNVNGIKGTGYWWDLGSIAHGTSHSPDITYRIQTTDPNAVPLTDVYLVGIDPAQSLNLQSTPALNTNATVMNTNMESVLAAGALCLVVIGLIGTVRRKF